MCARCVKIFLKLAAPFVEIFQKPRVGKKKNDALTIFFGTSVFLLLILSVLYFFASLGHPWSDFAAVNLVVACVGALAGYGVADTKSHVHRARITHQLESAETEHTNGPLPTAYYTEKLAAAFTFYLFTLIALVHFHTPLPFHWGEFSISPTLIDYLIDFVVGIMAAAALRKLRLVYDLRREGRLSEKESFTYLQSNRLQNTLLLRLSYFSTAVLIALFFNEGLGGDVVHPETVLANLNIVFFYSLHNRTMLSAFPEERRRTPPRRGELVGFSVLILTGILSILNFVGFLEVFPRWPLLMFFGTGLLLLGSALWSQFLTDSILGKERNRS